VGVRRRFRDRAGSHGAAARNRALPADRHQRGDLPGIGQRPQRVGDFARRVKPLIGLLR